MAVTENVYLGHRNEIALILKDNATAVDLASVSNMTFKLDRVLITSTNGSTQGIQWAQPTWATGEVHLLLGLTSGIEAGIYNAPLTVFTAASTAGIVWGNVRVRVWPNPEST